MKKSNSRVLRLGILGGGQLARMMALSCHNLGVQPWILSESASDPAAQVTRFWVKGSLKSATDIKKLARQVDQLTFESEFLEVQKLNAVSAKISPPVSAMAIVQDRLLQKQLLKKLSVPTLDFYQVDTATQAQLAFELCCRAAVFKVRRNGYDGYGTHIVNTPAQLKKFIQGPLPKSPFGFIAEPWVPFSRELAVMAGRTRSGRFEQYPWAETFQKNSRCFWVKGPIKNSNTLRAWPKHLHHILDELSYVGVMGFEFFEVNNRLFINELAPRVHNSGHYTIDAMNISQFEWHVRAVLGLPTPQLGLKSPGFAMVNLLGTKDRRAVPPQVSQGYLHWYGKAEERKGRKMGHINIVGSNPEACLRACLEI